MSLSSKQNMMIFENRIHSSCKNLNFPPLLKTKQMSTKTKMFLGILQKAGLLGCIGYTFKQYLFDIWVLEESSMEPTLKDGQIVVTTHKTSLSRGDIIIVKHPQSPAERVCKRIIG